MSAPSFMAYAIVAGALLMSLLAPLFVGGSAWFVPFAVLPFGVLYVLYDRRLARREAGGEGA